jgi:lipopolysaccharide export system protein LptC
MSSPTADLSGPGLAAEDIERRRRLLQEFKRHSGRVRVLRRLLPALCVALLTLLVGWATVKGLLLREGAKTHAEGAIRMVNPFFQGRTEAGRPFLVRAKTAVRDDVDANKVTLEEPVFTVGADAKDQTTVRAKQGLYRDDTKVLDLRGAVTLDDFRGNHFVTEHALVDTRMGNVDGDTPIQGHGPLGALSASSYAVHDNGLYAHFEGRVRSRIVQHPPAPPAAAPQKAQ